MARTETSQAEAGQATKPRARRPTRSKRVVEQVVRDYFGALARRDADAAAAHWSESAVNEVMPLGTFRGREQIRALLRELAASVPDLETSVGELVADTRRAAVEWTMAGSFSGAPFQGIQPTGRRIELRGVDLLEVEDAKIVRGSGYYDGAEFARQVGLLPAQDSGAERAMKGALNTVTRVRKLVDERRGGS